MLHSLKVFMGGRGGGPSHEVGDTPWEAVGGLVGLPSTWTGTLRFALCAYIWSDGFQQTLRSILNPKKTRSPGVDFSATPVLLVHL